MHISQGLKIPEKISFYNIASVYSHLNPNSPKIKYLKNHINLIFSGELGFNFNKETFVMIFKQRVAD